MVLSQTSTELDGNSVQGSTKVREWLGLSEWESELLPRGRSGNFRKDHWLAAKVTVTFTNLCEYALKGRSGKVSQNGAIGKIQ